MKSSVVICVVFVAGVALGALHLAPQALLKSNASLWTLYVLLFLIGVSIGASGKALRVIRKARVKVVLVPAAVVVGTFLGVAAASFVLPGLGVRESLAVGAGFGYYSLSSVIIRETFHLPTLAAIALIANLIREVATLLLAAPAAKWCGKLAPIGMGGATAMDTTLPVIMRSSGEEYGMIATFSGAMLSLVVPVIIPMILAGY
jgi:uncharacterized membrane protein YbjE (DUF340 family)